MAKKTDNSETRMVRLPRGKDDPETHPVIINGEAFHVPRGQEIEVPALVAEILEQAGMI